MKKLIVIPVFLILFVVWTTWPHWTVMHRVELLNEWMADRTYFNKHPLPYVVTLPNWGVRTLHKILAGASHDHAIAFYSFRHKIMFIPHDASNQVILHELVHHAQNMDGHRFFCSEGYEHQAYLMQQVYAEEQGEDGPSQDYIDSFRC